MPEVTRYLLAAPAMVVMLALVPVKAVVVAVTVVTVPATVCVVNTTVAMPLSFVVLVPVAKDPFTFDFVQVTTSLAVSRALPLASASCALIVTVDPAAGLEMLEVTMYLLASPHVPVALKVSGEPTRPARVAVSVLTPAVVPSVQLPTVAIPAELVVAASSVAEPPPVSTAKVTLTPATPLS